jgi:hypothetical protein
LAFFAKRKILIHSSRIQFTKLEKFQNKIMSPEQQRIRIAEACGWETNKRKWLAKPPSNSWQYLDTIPDYLDDLNAMHEAEKVLNNTNWWIFVEHLTNICGGGVALGISATAAQRAEAFLQTLNLWKQS